MPIEQMTDSDLLSAHREVLVKANAARSDGDLDTAQRYLRVLRPINAEMARRMRRI